MRKETGGQGAKRGRSARRPFRKRFLFRKKKYCKFCDEKIKFIWNTMVTEILGEKRVEGVRLSNQDTGEVWTMACDGVLLAIGWIPNTEIFRGQIDVDERGYIVSKSGVDTNMAGVYVCGDLNDRRYRQVVTACGSGCMAALEAERFLSERS